MSKTVTPACLILVLAGLSASASEDNLFPTPIEKRVDCAAQYDPSVSELSAPRPFDVSFGDANTSLLELFGKTLLASDYEVFKDAVTSIISQLRLTIPTTSFSERIRKMFEVLDVLESQKASKGYLQGAPFVLREYVQAVIFGETARALFYQARDPQLAYHILYQAISVSRRVGGKLWISQLRDIPGIARYYDDEAAQKDHYYDFSLLHSGPDAVRMITFENEMATLTDRIATDMTAYVLLNENMRPLIEAVIGRKLDNVMYMPADQLEVANRMGLFISSLLNPSLLSKIPNSNPLQHLQNEIPVVLRFFTRKDKSGLVDELRRFSKESSRSSGDPRKDEDRVRKIAGAVADLVVAAATTPWDAFDFILKQK